MKKNAKQITGLFPSQTSVTIDGDKSGSPPFLVFFVSINRSVGLFSKDVPIGC